MAATVRADVGGLRSDDRRYGSWSGGLIDDRRYGCADVGGIAI